MMQLTQEQHMTLEKDGREPVRAVDPTTLVEYVLLRADIYDRFKLLFAEDAAWANESSPAALEVFARDGWDDPRMDVYDSMVTRQDK